MTHQDLSLKLMNQNLLFNTPLIISKQLQKDIIREVLAEGSIVESEDRVTEPFWIGYGANEYKYISDVPNNPAAYEDTRLTYYLRLHEKLEWTWKDESAARLIREAVEPAREYFHNITRVTALLQIPGQPIPAHRDLIAENTYDNMATEELTFWGDKKLRYKGEEWLQRLELPLKNDIHSRNRYLSFKIPLSESDGPGEPFIIHNNQVVLYNSKDHGFFLNEAATEHGANPVNFYRGVIFVDGFINFDALEGRCGPTAVNEVKDTSSVVKPMPSWLKTRESRS